MTEEEKRTLIDSIKKFENIELQDNYKILIEKCILLENLNVKDNAGNTLLNYAIIIIDKELVEFLLKNGINPNLQNTQDKNSLIICINMISKTLENESNNIFKINSLLKILGLLIYYKANPNLQDENHHNSYYYAEDTKDLEEVVIKTLSMKIH